MSLKPDPDQLDLEVDLFVGGGWQLISEQGYVRTRKAIATSRGTLAENGQAQPSHLSLEVNNAEGRFSPRNPLGSWYETFGRNTPIRQRIRRALDRFSRLVTAGWGVAPTGQPWTATGGGGTVPGDFAVGASGATHSVSSVNAYRYTYLADVVHGKVDIAATVSLPVTDITGGDVEPNNLIVGYVSSTDYYMVRLVVTSAEALTVKLTNANGTDYASVLTVPGITHSAAQKIRVRAQLEGTTFRAKVWVASSLEPFAWTISGTVPARAGAVGIRSGVSAANTNTLPFVFTYTDVVVSSPRFAGEVSSWPPQWDLSGNDKWVPIEAYGVMRRLGKGAPTLQSAMTRATLASGPIAYWPCEDGADAVQFASALPGTPPLTIFGDANVAADSRFVCSAPLPTPGTSTWDAAIPAYTSTGKIQMRFLMRIPDGGVADDTIIARVYTTGSLTFWQLVAMNGGLLRLEGCRDESTIVVSSGNIIFNQNGKLFRMSIELKDNGSDVDWLFSALEVGASGGGFWAGTATTQSTGRATRVWMAPQRNMSTTVLGHICVYDKITSLFDLLAELNAFNGEKAADRVVRLCNENAVPVSVRGTQSATRRMGPQRIDTLLNLLRECELADMGLLYETAGIFGIGYRTLESMYSQSATVTLNYRNGHVAPPLRPVEDDQNTRNDVTAERIDGATARAVKSSGPLSTLDPSAGGVGRYPTTVVFNVETDGQLPDQAGWVLSLGTVDEPRYPEISVFLASPALLRNQAITAAVLDLDPGDRLVVTDTSDDSYNYDAIDQIIRGFTERMTPLAEGALDQRITFVGAPASPYQVGVLDDSSFDVLDSDSSTLGADLSETGMSFSIQTTGAELWSTDAGDYPLNVKIGGEVITLSGVSGSSSPQTATVSARGVNFPAGAKKKHNAGAIVRLASPNFAGL